MLLNKCSLTFPELLYVFLSFLMVLTLFFINIKQGNAYNYVLELSLPAKMCS